MNEQYALLQTDVVDSTLLNAQLGDLTMSGLWEEHDRLARDLLAVWRGREIDRTDGFLLVFAAASDAAEYAVAYHRALATLSVPLKARVGLHVGPLSIRENRGADVTLGAKALEVIGMAIPTTTRVMSAAQGGQTLMTAQAKSALGTTAQHQQSHGYWRMKGIEEPLELFEIGDFDSPFMPPPDSTKVYRVIRRGDQWLPLAQLRHSLPAERDQFIGRKESLQELAHALDAGARLVSVVGIGGIGKTRFVQRFGWTWLGDFSGGVWFCDLAQARGLDGIVHAVAQAIDLPLDGTNPVAQIGNAIAARGPCLVVIDNFEQVSQFAEQSIGQWLNRAGAAHFLVTTRAVLGIPGEVTLKLPPLDVQEGTALFFQRAAAAKRDFSPTDDDKVAIEPLIKLLDGLPLAIELAAARIRVMPPRTLLKRMSERFKLLSSSSGGRNRHATLRGTFDWSWELLSPAEKMALAQLSVFKGGFSLIAAEAIVDLSSCGGAPWTTDVLQSLVEKSWVRQATDRRFDLLVSVQEYAAEQLRASGSIAGDCPTATESAHTRHCRYFGQLNETEAVADKCVEIDNLVAACMRAAAKGDTKLAVGSLFGVWAALKLCGPFRQAVELASVIRRMGGLPPAEGAMVEWVAGSALHLLGNVGAARSHIDAGMSLARSAGDPNSEARLLYALSEQMAAAGYAEEALAQLTRALALARELDDRSLLCKVLNSMGALSRNRARLDEARTHYEAALSLAREIGDARLEGGLLGNLGGIDHSVGRMTQALDRYEQALVLARQAGDRRWEGNTRCNLGLLHHHQGRPAEARSQFEAALNMAREMGHARLECTVLCNLGIVVETQGDFSAARAHYEKAVAVAHDLGDRRSEGQFRGYLGLLYARLGSFSSARECLTHGETLLIEVSDFLCLGLLLCSRAEAEHLAGARDIARSILQRVELLASEIDASADSELGRALTEARHLIKGAGEDRVH